jgi:hypothetical protein
MLIGTKLSRNTVSGKMFTGTVDAKEIAYNSSEYHKLISEKYTQILKDKDSFFKTEDG